MWDHCLLLDLRFLPSGGHLWVQVPEFKHYPQGPRNPVLNETQVKLLSDPRIARVKAWICLQGTGPLRPFFPSETRFIVLPMEEGQAPAPGFFSLPSSVCRRLKPDPGWECGARRNDPWKLQTPKSGLPIPREYLVSYLEQRELPLMLEQEGLRSCCPEGTIRPRREETTEKLRISVKEGHQKNLMSDSSYAFTGRELCAINDGIHTREKPHGCHHCGQTMGQQSSLIYFQKSHTGEKPYESHECDVHFSEHSSFLFHDSIHSERKPQM
ncbi:uncharacterized protein [Notamacropus eugenii]|uniref:uncharacterized protein n=1 Tax=Notamacropus eugenii TaxID=9315 RepID=UPI003B67E62E